MNQKDPKRVRQFLTSSVAERSAYFTKSYPKRSYESKFKVMDVGSDANVVSINSIVFAVTTSYKRSYNCAI